MSGPTLAPLATVLAFKAARSVAYYAGFDTLHVAQYPVLGLALLLLAGAALVTLLAVQPWKGKALSVQSLVLLLVHSGLLAAQLVLYLTGLKHYGPLKTLLAVEYGDVVLHVLLRGAGERGSKMRGVLVCLCAYFLMFLIGETPEVVQETVGQLLVMPQVAPESHDVSVLGLFSISEGKVGGLSLLLALGVTMLRKRVARKMSAVGTPKRVLALSLVCAAVLMLPAGAVSLSTSSAPSMSHSLGTLLALVLFVVLADLFVAPIVEARAPTTSAFAVLSLSVSFFVALVTRAVWTDLPAPSSVTYVSFALVATGLFFLFRKDGKLARGGAVPLYVAPRRVLSRARIVEMVRHVAREIWYDKESRRIFFFLSINLVFMFVEMVYGFLTNSLGLISDAFHMLFDNVSLVIGLWASIIAQWPADTKFTYGYGRVKVLSGFVNGVFLLFISLFVFLESISRIFEPPEIKPDKLLLVSVLGLIVNLFGIWAFHDLHGGGSHAGHSHSHGHSHDHGGSKPKKKKKKPQQQQQHGHEHAHDHHAEENKGHSHAHDHAEENKGHSHVHDHAVEEHPGGGHAHAHDHGHDHDHETHHVDEQKGHSHAHKHEHEHGHEHGASCDDLELGCDEHDDEDEDHHDSHGHENIAGVYLHILADTLGSVGVIISALLIKYFGWTIADPICSFIIAVMILLSTIPLLRETSFTLLLRTPQKSEGRLKKCLRQIAMIKGVRGFEEPHFWLYAGDDMVGSLHVLVGGEADPQAVLQGAKQIMSQHKVGKDVCVQVTVQ